jgi:hypothetical protein
MELGNIIVSKRKKRHYSQAQSTNYYKVYIYNKNLIYNAKAVVLIILLLFVLMIFKSIQTSSIVYYIELINIKLINSPATVSAAENIAQPTLPQENVLLSINYISAECIDSILKTTKSLAQGTEIK